MEKKFGDKNNLSSASHSRGGCGDNFLLVYLPNMASPDVGHYHYYDTRFRQILLRLALPLRIIYGSNYNATKSLQSEVSKSS